MNENIWLIKNGENDYTWCDCPDPSDDIDPEDTTKYVRADVKMNRQDFLNELSKNIQFIFDNAEQFFEHFGIEGKNLKQCHLSSNDIRISFLASVFHNINYYEMYAFIPIINVLDWIDEMQSKEK